MYFATIAYVYTAYTVCVTVKFFSNQQIPPGFKFYGVTPCHFSHHFYAFLLSSFS